MKRPVLPYDTENINNLLADWHLWVYYNDTITRVKYKGDVSHLEKDTEVLPRESTYFT